MSTPSTIDTGTSLGTVLDLGEPVEVIERETVQQNVVHPPVAAPVVVIPAPPPAPEPIHHHKEDTVVQKTTIYSEYNQIPTISKYLENQEREHQDNYDGSLSDDELQEAKDREAEQNEAEKEDDKDAIKKRMKPDEGKKTDEVKEKKGKRTVKDPTTGYAVTIKDAEMKEFPLSSLMNAIRPPPSPKEIHHSRTSPVPAHPSNISLLPYPSSESPALESIHQYIDWFSTFAVASSVLLWAVTASSGGWISFVLKTGLIGALGAGGWYLGREIKDGLHAELEVAKKDFTKRRPGKFETPMPESTEWLNSLVGAFWKLLSSEMFLTTATGIEDTIKASAPFLAGVKFTDIDLGAAPLRILEIRGLADSPSDRKYPREEWINLGKDKYKFEESQSGDYTNLEISFAYSGRKGVKGDTRPTNIQFTLELVAQIMEKYKIPIPIWIRLNRIVATIRLRLQFIPIAPFVRNVSFALMDAPDIDVAISIQKYLPNLLDLPLLSSMIKLGLKTGTKSLTAPRSMTMNLQDMVSPVAIGETKTQGVLVITIHYGEGLSAQDRNGSSDPYIVMSYAKFGKPLYSTRIIVGDLNPVFEETCYLLVNSDDVKSQEALSVCLWDSDKLKSDDLIGRVNVPLLDIMARPNVMMRRKDGLSGFEDANSMQGTIHWSVGYYERAALLKEMESPEENPAAPPTTSLIETETMMPGEKAPFPAKTPPPPPPDATRTPPNPKYKSGILSVLINHINSLERKPTDDPKAPQTPPSAYIELFINEELATKTRVRQYTSMPFFVTLSEHFVRNWKDAHVQMVVRDASWYEQDPILGVVTLDLIDLFTKSSEVTKMFAMEHGSGNGQIHASLKFSGVKMDLPPNLSGYEAGTIQITEPIVADLSPQYTDLAEDLKHLRMVTNDSSERLPKKEAVVDGSRITWDVDNVRLPVYSRYQSCLSFQFQGSKLLGLGKELKAISSLWLQELVDEETRTIRIPIIIAKDLVQLRQNYLNDFCASTHEYKVVGWLSTTVLLDAGLDEDHEARTRNQAHRHAYEVWNEVDRKEEVVAEPQIYHPEGVIDQEELHQKQEVKRVEIKQEKKSTRRHRSRKSMSHFIEKLKGHHHD
ncbi:Ca2-dependent lipid-binding protein CLB1/vesicle protein vp115/Granuphilin A, contains C2 domain [Phaffia rhodozyma]|uniref:Ca2-dependent lipid-binding protein CLB1/vesicle protein vp115/Granuphilin A, contains C2 domain n=1 Tax=Phaffia rhodozyma TaxID=264483 RepID=A0A0F7SIP3_PHARH|nr:Ca2-dependent lipid-binding protein CLB1/vesicle protein vp115/Granuphilin A, contains C2 domain [Phaffia rhodozyma]